MKKLVGKLKNRINDNLIELELCYDHIHLFLLQLNLIWDAELDDFRIKEWFYDNRFTINIIDEILEQIENDQKITA